MPEVCELLVTTKEGQILAGVIELHDDGSVSSGYSDGYENLVSNVLDTPVLGVDRESDSEAWFDGLPSQYSGSYFRVAKVSGIKAYGTSEGVKKEWDTRGRGRKAEEMFPYKLYRGTTTRKLAEIAKRGVTPATKRMDVTNEISRGVAHPVPGNTYVTYDKHLGQLYAQFKKAYNETEPGHNFTYNGIWWKPKNAPAAVQGTKPVLLTMRIPRSLSSNLLEDPESPDSADSYMFKGTIPKEYIEKAEVLEGGEWKSLDWKKGVAAAADEDDRDIYVVLDDIKDLDGDYRPSDPGVLFRGVKIIGFTSIEEEQARAYMSRIPPELIRNVKRVVADPSLGAIHGRYDDKSQTISFNPKTFQSKVVMGKGPAKISHAQLTMVHEFGHALYSSLPEKLQDDWRELSGWMKGTQEGQAPPYKEKRPGWPSKTSTWTHRKGAEFTRYYGEKNDDEDAADTFAFVLLGKGAQAGSVKRKWMANLLMSMIHKYPQASIQGPEETGS